MPELPEVETIVRQLSPLVVGREVLRLELVDPLLKHQLHRRADQNALIDSIGSRSLQLVERRRLERVMRLGKQIVIELTDRGTALAKPIWPKPIWLGIHLRMTGRLIWWPPARGPEPARVRARLMLSGGSLLFADLRRLGTLCISTELASLAPVGTDPLDPCFTAFTLSGLLHGSTQSIKCWLMRQDRLVGLGNIYVCEALFRAGIDPRRAAGGLDEAEVHRLQRAIVAVLQKAIANCGTTFSDFQDAHGVTGSYQRYLRVYGREGEPCASCGVGIARIVQQQRSTFYCPCCQGVVGSNQDSLGTDNRSIWLKS